MVDNACYEEFDRISKRALLLCSVSGQVFGDLYQFNIKSKIWSLASNTTGPSPSERYNHGLASLKEKLYVFGGQINVAGQSSYSVNAVF